LTSVGVASANFTAAEVRGAYLPGLSTAQLYSTANYQNHDLSGINFTSYSMPSWNFAGQNLTKAVFQAFADLTSADFSHANLTDAVFSSTSDEGGWPAGSHLAGANFSYAKLTNANFAGSNLLQNDAAATSDLKIVASYNRVGATVTIDTIDVKAADTQVLDVAGTGGIVGGLLAATFFAPTSTVAVTPAAIDTALGSVETALAKLSTGAASLGAAKSRIDTQKSFLSNLSDSIDKGVGALVDADMNKESTRLQALQVQQQLGIQALSIANQAPSVLLSLFRGG
jgi:flagellin-like hook-associated protein FlgL